MECQHHTFLEDLISDILILITIQYTNTFDKWLQKEVDFNKIYMDKVKEYIEMEDLDKSFQHYLEKGNDLKNELIQLRRSNLTIEFDDFRREVRHFIETQFSDDYVFSCNC